jgi:amidohydrolase
MKSNILKTPDLKEEINRQIDAYRERLIELGMKIHDNPELGFKEVKACGWITDFLSKEGFRIENNTGGLSTAFKASYGKGRPVIAFLAEYDALSEAGHSCGHNIIAASATGAGVACKYLMDRYAGTIEVIGTPGEEVYGGKSMMLEAGVFTDVDVAMEVHPGVGNVVIIDALACVGLDVEFFGKAAHAAAHPEQGINALEAMLLGFHGINSLRQHIPDRARIHGIITSGGEMVNVIPDYSSAQLLVRAPDRSCLNELKQKVLDCFRGAALAIGARLEYKWSDVTYDAMNNNRYLARLFAHNLESLGREVAPMENSCSIGSTDMGNVSQVVPAVHPVIEIAPEKCVLHSEEFIVAAASEQGMQGLIDAAKAMAMTAVDLIAEPAHIEKVKEEFFTGNR